MLVAVEFNGRFSTMLAGGVTSGGVWSTTVTFWLDVAVLPTASVAVQITSVVPTGKVLPEGLRVTVTTPQLSLAAGAVKVTVVSQDVAPEPVFAVTSAGSAIVGATLSITVMIWVALDA